MFYALDEFGNRLHISCAVSGQAYYCPVCKSRVLIRKGDIVSHHFYHKSNKHCDPWYKNKMSQWHLDMQNLFPEENREVIVQDEDNSEFHIADVLLETSNKHYVFEFQHSSISVKDFILRSCFYVNLGYSLIWVFDLRDSQKPKCLYYEDLDYNFRYKHVVWPGKDRLRMFDSRTIRSFLDECQENGIEISILFHAYTGLSKQSVIHCANGFEFVKWHYIDPIHREEYFIRPDFDSSKPLSNFYASFFTKDEFIQHAKRLMK